MKKRLFVGNLSFDTDARTLEAAFGAQGREVDEVQVVIDPLTRRPRGYALVTMGSEEHATAAIEALDGTELDGRRIEVSTEREPMLPTGGRRNDRW